MPNIVMEYSDPVAEQVNIAALIDDLHRVCLNSELFKSDDVKTRSYRCHDWQIGEHDNSQDFIHLSVSLLSGRDDNTKANLSQALLEVLQHHATSVFTLSVEIRDMERATYSKTFQSNS